MNKYFLFLVLLFVSSSFQALPVDFITPEEAAIYVRDNQENWTPDLGRRMVKASLRMVRLSRTTGLTQQTLREFVYLTTMWAQRANVSLDTETYNCISRCMHILERSLAQ